MNKVTKVLRAGKLLLALALMGCSSSGSVGADGLGGAMTTAGGAPGGASGADGAAAHAGDAGAGDNGGAAGGDSAEAGVAAGGDAAGAQSSNGGGGQTAAGGSGGHGGAVAGASGSPSGGSAGQAGGDEGGGAGAAPCECKKYPSDPTSSQCCDGCHLLPKTFFVKEVETSAVCVGNKLQVTLQAAYCTGESPSMVSLSPDKNTQPPIACFYAPNAVGDPYATGTTCFDNGPGNAICVGQ